MRILVTGGAGYIGSHLCKALAKAGYLPIVYDNLVYGHRWAVNWGPLEEGDVTDRKRLNQVFSRYEPEAVLHFAGYAYVGESVENPGKYYRNNVVGSLALVEAMRDFHVNNIVFSSTCATYGIPNTIPIAEDHAQAPINPYGASKLMIERILQDFGRVHGIRSVFLRYFNAAGADLEGDLGEEHEPETHLIPLVIKAALRQIAGIKIFGTDYPTPDGTAIRDYIHVTDLADAHILALRYLLEGKESVAINLGTGKGHSVHEVISAAERIIGRPIHSENAPRRPGDPPVLIADSTRAHKLLNWSPHYSDLDRIVETVFRWATRQVTSSGFKGQRDGG